MIKFKVLRRKNVGYVLNMNIPVESCRERIINASARVYLNTALSLFRIFDLNEMKKIKRMSSNVFSSFTIRLFLFLVSYNIRLLKGILLD